MYHANDDEKIVRLAGELYDALEYRGEKPDRIIRLKGDCPAWMDDVVDEVQDRTSDDTNEVYDIIHTCADAISQYDDPDDAIRELEPDIYTSDLDDWFPDHSAYVNNAYREFGPFDDVHDAIQAAQKMQIEEIGAALISALNDVDDPDDEDSEPVEAVYTAVTPADYMISNDLLTVPASVQIWAAQDWHEIERIELVNDRYIVYPVGVNVTVSGTAQDVWQMREHENYPEGL